MSASDRIRTNTDIATAPGSAANIAQAGSTLDRAKVAINLFNDFQMSRYEFTFDDLKIQNVSNENMRAIIGEFALYLGKSAIPNLKNSATNIVGSTKGKYLTSLKEALKKVFPIHEDWKGTSDFPDWFKNLQAKLHKEATRTSSNDELKDSTMARPIYKNIQESLHYEVQEGKEGVDLESMMKVLMSKIDKRGGFPPNKTPMQLRAQIVDVYLSVGRPGECKFLRYDQFLWDPIFHSVDAAWYEPKTQDTKRCLYPPDPRSYECDFYHALGCYWIIDNGLFRNPAEADPSLKAAINFVFPHCHCARDSQVAQTLTAVLKELSPEALKKTTTSKGLRRGSNTQMAAHRQVTFHEQQARGGWSTGSRSDVYADFVPSMSYIAGLCLSGYKNCLRNPVMPPRLECVMLPTGYTWQLIIDEFYLLDDVMKERYFSPRALLYPLICTVTASLIMYYNKVVEDFSSRFQLISKMNKAVSKGLKVDAIRAAQLLRDWSATIHQDFLDSMDDTSVAATDLLNEQYLATIYALKKQGADQAVIINSQSRTLQNIEETLAQMNENQKSMLNTVRDLQRSLSSAQFATSAPFAASTNSSFEEIESPPRKRSRIASTQVVQVESINDDTTTNSVLSPAPTNTNTGTHASPTVSSVMKELREDGRLRLTSDNKLIFSNIAAIEGVDKSKVQHVLGLFQRVWDKDSDKQFQSFLNPDISAGIIETLSLSFEKECCDEMLRLEASLMCDESKKQKHLKKMIPGTEEFKKSRTKPKLTGLAERYRRYIADATSNTSTKEKDTSTGSIQSFFSSKNRPNPSK